MPLPIPALLQGEMFFDYIASQLWVGTITSGNQQIPLSTLNGITFPDATIQSTAATSAPVKAAQHARVSAGTIGSALISLPITIDWATPFVDNNYTVLATCVIGEATSDGAVTSIICIASVQLLAAGAGVIVTVANADSIPHSCTIHLYAVHD